MRDSEKEQLREQLKARIEQGGVLPTDRRGKGFLCPSCGNGGGKSGDGLHFKKGGDLLFCFSCGKSFDVFQALGAQEGLSDFGAIMERACQITGFTPSETFTAQGIDRGGPQSPKSEGGRKEAGTGQKTAPKRPGVDYSAYFDECMKRNDGSELLKRGISEELQIKHKIGIDPLWENPTSPKDPKLPRLIIPTSSGSYIARKIGPTSPNFDDRIRKAGEAHFMNEETLFNREDSRPCFIVEGEIDALSLEEVGFRAVGIGGTSGANRLLEIVRDLELPPVFILSLDNDDSGRKIQDGKIDPQTGYLDPNDRGLYMELSSLGIQVYRADLTGSRWSRTESPLKDVNDFLREDREAFTEWAQEQTEQAFITVLEEREKYLRESSDALDSFDQQSGKIARPIPTGFRALDKLLGGGLRVGLTTLGAGTSFGKTALSMQIAENIVRGGEDVLFFSLEMGKNELIARSLSRLTGEILNIHKYSFSPASSFSEVLNYRNLPDGQQRETVEEARNLYRSYCRGLRIEESQGEFSVEDVRRAVSKHKRLTGRTPVVFIDYLQVLHPVNPRESEKQQTDKNILELRRIAREFETVVVVLSSLNRAGYKKRPTLESFKESGGVEYGSDIVLMLSFEQRDELFIEIIDEETGKKKKAYDYDRAKRESPRKMLLSLLKNRNGNPTGTVNLDNYSKYSLFIERLAQDSASER